jgi:hypothetical protein
MVKNKLIQIRLNDDQFNQIIKKAKSNDQSVSVYAREILLQPEFDTEAEEKIIEKDIKIPVFQKPEFLKVVIWIYSKKNPLTSQNNMEETKLMMSLIDSFLMDLEPQYLEFFYNVKQDLKRSINEHTSFFGITYSFYDPMSNVYFNYIEFEKMLITDVM